MSAPNAIPIEVRIYDYLFAVERPMEVEAGKTFLDNLSPNSLEVVENAWAEPCLAEAKDGDRFQFERLGYFARDPDTGNDGKPVLNKTVGLRDTWAKIAAKKK